MLHAMRDTQTRPIRTTEETSPIACCLSTKLPVPRVLVLPLRGHIIPKLAQVDVHGLNREIGHSALRCRSTINKRVACDIDVLCCIMYSSQDRSLAPLDHPFDCTLVF